MNMREKIARAAHDAQWEEPFPKEGTIAHAITMQVADAVLDALLEPTEEMCLSTGDGPNTSRRLFTSMIHAAKEGE